MTVHATHIRDASLEDANIVAVLMNDLGYQVASATISEKIAAFRTSPTDAVFVAILEGCIVGVTSLHALPMFHRSGNLGRITSLVVDSKARGKGVGTALVDRSDEWFAWKDCVKIEVTSGDHRIDAHLFYHRRGFQRDGQRLAKSLVPPI